MRQAASIQFKTLVGKGWDPRGEASARLHEEDKATVRANVLEALIQSPPIIRSQLVECMKVMVNADFPEKWPDLLSTLIGFMQTDDVPRVYGAVQVIMLLCRKYEFKDKDEREVLAPVIDAAFPRLLTMLQNLLSMTDRVGDLQLALLVKLIVKTYWSATYLDIPGALMRGDVYGAWITCMHQIIVMPVPEEGQSAEKAERKNFPWWGRSRRCLQMSLAAYRLTQGSGVGGSNATDNMKALPSGGRLRSGACTSPTVCSAATATPRCASRSTASSPWPSSATAPRRSCPRTSRCWRCCRPAATCPTALSTWRCST